MKITIELGWGQKALRKRIEELEILLWPEGMAEHDRQVLQKFIAENDYDELQAMDKGLTYKWRRLDENK